MIEIRRLSERVPTSTNRHSAQAVPGWTTMHAFYSEVERMAGIGCWYYNPADRALFWSDELFQMHEIAPDASLNTDQYVGTFVHPDDRESVAAMFASLISGSAAEINSSARIVSKNGLIRRLQFQAHRESSSGDTDSHYIGIVQEQDDDRDKDLSIRRDIDVSALNPQSVSIRSREPVISFFVEAAPEPVVVTDESGRIVMMNRQMEAAFGYDEQELTGEPIRDILEADGSVAMLEVDPDETIMPHRHTMLGRHKTGQELPLEVHTSRIDTAEGALTVHFILDVSRHRRAEQELRNALQQERELSELKSRFVSIVSHEFRTPLAVIQATSETLRDFIDQMDEEQWTRKFNKISGQISHMTDMLEDILVFGKMASATIELKREPVALCELLQEAVDSAKQRYSRHTFVTTCGASMDTIDVDRKLIHQALSNLLSNAAKYSAVGTEIALDVTYKTPYLCVAVRDEGIGIPPEDQTRLFEPFHRGANATGRQGTGLGLSIAKQAAELHGGSLTFTSVVGVGTTFTLAFPVEPPLRENTTVESL